MKIEIKHRVNGSILFSGEFGSTKIAVVAAIRGGADLQGADLQGADLQGADLQGACLRGAIGFHVWACPPSGGFTAWKKGGNGEIIKLKIPWWSRRVSPVGCRKCRAEFAITLSIEKNGKSEASCENWNNNYPYTYEVGKVQGSPNGYDATLLDECRPGIHFFLTKKDAEDF